MIRMGGIGLGTRIILLIIYMIDMHMYIISIMCYEKLELLLSNYYINIIYIILIILILMYDIIYIHTNILILFILIFLFL